jgi:hypothetical protein
MLHLVEVLNMVRNDRRALSGSKTKQLDALCAYMFHSVITTHSSLAVLRLLSSSKSRARGTLADFLTGIFSGGQELC